MIKFDQSHSYTLVSYTYRVDVPTESKDGFLKLDTNKITQGQLSFNISDLVKASIDQKIGIQVEYKDNEDHLACKVLMTMRGSVVMERAKQKYTEEYFENLVSQIDIDNLIQGYITQISLSQLKRKILGRSQFGPMCSLENWHGEGDFINQSDDIVELRKEVHTLENKLREIKSTLNAKIKFMQNKQCLINIDRYLERLQQECTSLSKDEITDVVELLLEQKKRAQKEITEYNKENP